MTIIAVVFERYYSPSNSIQYRHMETYRLVISTRIANQRIRLWFHNSVNSVKHNIVKTVKHNIESTAMSIVNLFGKSGISKLRIQLKYLENLSSCIYFYFILIAAVWAYCWINICCIIVISRF